MIYVCNLRRKLLREGKSKEETKDAIEHVLRFKNYHYVAASEDQFKNKKDLFVHYMDPRKDSLAQTQKKMSILIKKSNEKVS